VAPTFAPRTSAALIIEGIKDKARQLELHEAKPWEGMDFGVWGPADPANTSAVLKRFLTEKRAPE
jgi:hypothetical protein